MSSMPRSPRAAGAVCSIAPSEGPRVDAMMRPALEAEGVGKVGEDWDERPVYPWFGNDRDRRPSAAPGRPPSSAAARMSNAVSPFALSQRSGSATSSTPFAGAATGALTGLCVEGDAIPACHHADGRLVGVTAVDADDDGDAFTPLEARDELFGNDDAHVVPACRLQNCAEPSRSPRIAAHGADPPDPAALTTCATQSTTNV